MKFSKLTALILFLFIILAPLNAHAVDVSTWTDRSVGGNSLFGTAYGGGLFVATGLNGQIWSSPDGIAWTDRSPGGNNLWGVAYGGSLFVAVGDAGRRLRSIDGINWTNDVTVGTDLLDVAYGGVFVAVGNTGRRLRSLDGITWTNDVTGGDWLRGAAYGGGLFVAVGSVGRRLRSVDGITWTNDVTGGTELWGAAYGGGMFVAVGASGQIWSSPDGSAWTNQGTWGTNDLYDVGYGGGLFVAVGNNGQIWSSPDGSAWTNRGTWGTNALWGVAYTSDTFVAVGASGQIWQSGRVTASSGSTSHTLVVYKTGADPAGMGYVYSEPAGISCPGTCSSTFADGTEVTLYAKNTNGMEFFRYEGDCADVQRASPCVLTMDGYKEVPVRFYPPEPRLTLLKLDPITGIGEPVPFSENPIEFTSDTLKNGCAAQTVILHNSANRSLDVGTIGGEDPLDNPFSITDDTCSDTTLPFQSDCTFMIEYCPSGNGPYTDTFDLPSSDPNYPSQTVEVTGGD